MQRRYVWLIGLVVMVCVGWSAVWFYASHYGAGLVDRWLAREASLGRKWDCRDRDIAGYPFRFVIRCSALALEAQGSRGRISAHFGPVRAITQVYNPKLILAEADGPVTVQTSGQLKSFDASWKSLSASIRLARPLPQRISVRVEGLKAKVVPADRDPESLDADALEFHLRPAPDVVAEIGAADLALTVNGLASRRLDQVVGIVAPANAAISLRVTRMPLLISRPTHGRLERWRQAKGNVTIRKSVVGKGPLEIEASGLLELDEEHRLAGKIDTRTAGASLLLQRFGMPGGRSPAGGLLGKFFGGRAKAAESPAEKTAKTFLPLPLSLRDGAVWVGPIRTKVRLTPLY